MRRFFFLAVAAATLALVTADSAQAGGRRTRYYAYGGTRAAVTQGTTSQAAPANPAPSNTAQANAAGTNTVRRYSYAPAQGSTTRYSYNSGYNNGRPWVMGSQPYSQNYWRADRKIKGY